MTIQMALLPVFVLVLLPFILLIGLGARRRQAIASRAVRRSEVALGEKNWPTPVVQIGNAFANHFELPVLFYVLVALALPLRQMDVVMVVLAWVFVISRYVHAFVYATSNYIPARFGAFAIGAVVLLVMWVYFALKIFAAGL